MSLVVYGLKTCDTCRKAMSQLEAAGRESRFVDIRGEADLARKVPEWLSAAGAERLVNKRSTTWRQLSASDKAKAEGGQAATLLIASPTLIKRPVIERGRDVLVGWGADVSGALLKVQSVRGRTFICLFIG